MLWLYVLWVRSSSIHVTFIGAPPTWLAMPPYISAAQVGICLPAYSGVYYPCSTLSPAAPEVAADSTCDRKACNKLWADDADDANGDDDIVWCCEALWGDCWSISNDWVSDVVSLLPPFMLTAVTEVSSAADPSLQLLLSWWTLIKIYVSCVYMNVQWTGEDDRIQNRVSFTAWIFQHYNSVYHY